MFVVYPTDTTATMGPYLINDEESARDLANLLGFTYKEATFLDNKDMWPEKIIVTSCMAAISTYSTVQRVPKYIYNEYVIFSPDINKITTNSMISCTALSLSMSIIGKKEYAAPIFEQYFSQNYKIKHKPGYNKTVLSYFEKV